MTDPYAGVAGRPPRAASTRSPAATSGPASPAATRIDERAPGRQHGPAAPVDARRAPAGAGARGRDGHPGAGWSSATCTPASRRTPSTATGRRASTFVTRSDYLSPLFNETGVLPGRREAARHRGAGARATHAAGAADGDQPDLLALVWFATGGMELGALTAMTNGFREREMVPRRARADHRPADEPRVRPPRRRRAGPARPARSRRSASSWLDMPQREVDDLREAAHRAADLAGPAEGRRLPRRAPAASRSASPARCCAPPACRGTCARSSRTAATRPTTSTCRPPTRGDCWARYLVRMAEMRESLKIVEQALDRLEPGPVMVADTQDRLAGAAGARRRRPGQLARPREEDHGPVDGGADPPLQAGHRGLPGAGRPGLRAGRVAPRRARLPRGQRRRHPAVPGARARALASSTCRRRRR